MAQRVNRQALIDVYLHNLDGTLEESAHSARTIERSLALAAPKSKSVPLSPGITAAHAAASTRQFAQAARRLVQNVSDCRASLQKLQRELKHLRAG